MIVNALGLAAYFFFEKQPAIELVFVNDGHPEKKGSSHNCVVRGTVKR